MLPSVMNELYIRNSDVHSYNTRRSTHLHVPNGTETKTFLYKSVLIWNELIIQKVDSNLPFQRYKHILKTYLLHNEINIGYTT